MAAGEVIHVIGFQVNKQKFDDPVVLNPVGFSFDSTVHFFDEKNWFFSDN